ncbi:MAG: hypothetical protein C4292_07155 [Nitrososphaera sp.]
MPNSRLKGKSGRSPRSRHSSLQSRGGNRHHHHYRITTITGPQAEAIKRTLEGGQSLVYVDRSVPGAAVLEVYEDG